ncbi:alpha/beta hydrolase [Pseudonocardia yuanmonensis]|uniref:Alpha/beta hydrolase n=1 Tax=Pseudonocardia yuanmonensis TaxID=1095914 RepID=A0ABP8VU62_9PSEU
MSERVLDPQVKALLEQLAEAGQPPFEHMTVPQARRAAWAFADLQGPAPDVGEVQHRFIPGPTADLPARIYRPAGDRPRPAIVYFHGSGWVILNIEICDPSMRALANDTDCIVVAVNYQKAPEHKFPVPFNDAWATTCWVAEHAEELGIDPARIAVGGDSAGGNLAAAVALKARDQGGPPLAYQLLVYPATDHDVDKPSAVQNAEGYLLQRESMRWFWGHYLDGATDEPDWRASPLRAGTLADLPPALVVTAEFDPLRDDGRLYADRLRAEGVKVTYSEYRGMIHGFYWMQGVLDRSRDLHAEIAREVRAALHSAD